MTSSTPTPGTGPRTSEDQAPEARHRDEGTAETGDAASTAQEPTSPGPGGPATTEPEAGPDLAATAAEAERALAAAAKAAEQAVAEAHDDGQDAVKKGFDDARRAAEEAYEQSSSRTDREE